MSKQVALILAAGKGTRMYSEKPKVLQTLLGSPMLAYVYRALSFLSSDDIWTVIGYAAPMVREMFPDRQCIVQREQLGTGHAVNEALGELAGADRILVVNGDAPLLTAEIVRDFLQKAEGCDLAFATAVLDDPGAYGRVVRKNGCVSEIVEAKNYDVARHGQPSGEINVGLYQISVPLAQELIPALEKNPVSGEYYLTDLVSLARARGKRVEGIALGRDTRLLGINSPAELVAMEEYLRERIVQEAISSGVLIHAPSLVRIGPSVTLEKGVEITGPCELYGETHIQSGAVIASHCVLRDATVHANAQIREFSHIEKAEIGEKALVGPYARLRPGARLDTNSHVGNFVELKKAHLGAGAKANHLTYLGDAEIGPGTNIGAGTITCNYDGVHKHTTTIGADAFIGSNTALVAPVRVGERALIGAGSTITHDVPDGNLSVARGKQKNYAERLRRVTQEKKD